MSRDTLFHDPQAPITEFVFDDRVARVFPDMIRRSVPGYQEVITLSGLIARRHAQRGSRLYDLGCSLGATTLAMGHWLDAEGCRIVAVDNAAPMLERCRENIEAAGLAVPVELVCADIRDVRIEDASVVVLNFTLQFLPPAERLEVLRAAASGMRAGGVLLLSEKIASSDAEEAAFHEQMHVAFKQANGYSDLEISRKRSALENVLTPETLTTHQERLLSAGFARVHTWFRCFNFASLVAIR